MTAYLEVRNCGDAQLIALDGGPLTIGRAALSDIPLAGDNLVSRRHAMILRRAGGWCITDLGSRNGTFVNETPVAGELALRPGDEIRLGASRLIYRQDRAEDDNETGAAEQPPRLTPQEREVLLALFRCSPGGAFSEPASIKEMAEALKVSESAIKQHIMHLFAKFGIPAGVDRRRLLLANEALRRGAVLLGEIRRDPPR